MENVDICVCCGDVVPEGTMVCYKCLAKYNDIDAHPEKYLEKYYAIKLRWYQKALLKVVFKIPRKGLHRYF